LISPGCKYPHDTNVHAVVMLFQKWLYETERKREKGGMKEKEGGREREIARERERGRERADISPL
jgi:hypothetical protein